MTLIFSEGTTFEVQDLYCCQGKSYGKHTDRKTERVNIHNMPEIIQTRWIKDDKQHAYEFAI